MQPPRRVLALLLVVTACPSEERATVGPSSAGFECPTIFVSLAGLGVRDAAIVANPCRPGEAGPNIDVEVTSQHPLLDNGTVAFAEESGGLSFTLQRTSVSADMVEGTYLATSISDPPVSRMGRLVILVGPVPGTIVNVISELNPVSVDLTRSTGLVASACDVGGTRCTALVGDGSGVQFALDDPVWALDDNCIAAPGDGGFTVRGSRDLPLVNCNVGSQSSFGVEVVGAANNATASIGGAPAIPVDDGQSVQVPGGSRLLLLAAAVGGEEAQISCSSQDALFGPASSALEIDSVRAPLSCVVVYGQFVTVDVALGGRVISNAGACEEGTACTWPSTYKLDMRAFPNAGFVARFSGTCADTDKNSGSIPAGASGACRVDFELDAACQPPTVSLTATAEDGSELVDLKPSTPEIDLEVTTTVRFRVEGARLDPRADVTLVVNGAAIAEFDGGEATVAMGEVLASPEVYVVQAELQACGAAVLSDPLWLRRR